MFAYETTKVLDIELTNRCNAGCPQCSRHIPEFGFNESEHATDITLANMRSWFSEQDILHFDKLQFCGNFGDPCAARDLVPIIQWAKSINPDITIGFNTNGSIRAPKWWNRMGYLLNSERDYVIFSIDGLQDTNERYRIGCAWDKIMNNARAFIEAGGRAHWDMLVFDYNQHQIDQCRTLASDMGFKFFRTKASSRGVYQWWHKYFPHTPDNLEHDYTPHTDPDTIDIKCFATEENSVYITCTGLVLPCCMLGSRIYLDQISENFPELLQPDKISLKHRAFREVFPELHSLAQTWHTKTPYDRCVEMCNSKSLCKDMWQTEVQF